MNVGDELRKEWIAFRGGEIQGDAGAILAVANILHVRQEQNAEQGVVPSEDETLAHMPLESVAYVVDSLKHPDELDRLRRIYGPAFVGIGIYAPPDVRRDALMLDARGDDERNLVDKLIYRDAQGHKLGQRVGEAFYGTDFIIDATREAGELAEELNRLIKLLFGALFITPHTDEYGLFLARAAQARSGSMARQIGAAILRSDGSVVACGTNEVAKPLVGGQYWPDDDETYHGRDFEYEPVEGQGVQDTSDWFRLRMAQTVIQQLNEQNALSECLSDLTEQEQLQELYVRDGAPLRNSLIKDNIDYIRAVHAEAAAIIDAGRHGVPVKGARMYTTTFPCHECSRHIVAAGIDQVVYLEPYPKSGTKDLYRDSISVDPKASDEKRVTFRTFVGVAPTRYLEFFTVGQRDRKNKEGRPIEADVKTCPPALPYYTPSVNSVIQSEGIPQALFSEFNDHIKNTGGLNEQST